MALLNVFISARKAIGVQTDIAVESTDVIIKNDLSTSHQCSRKLLGIWDLTFDQQTGKNLVSKLFVTCETDFHVLFGYLNSNSSFKTTVDSLANEYSSDVSLQRSTQPARSAEAAKISHLYYMLTKVHTIMRPLHVSFITWYESRLPLLAYVSNFFTMLFLLCLISSIHYTFFFKYTKNQFYSLSFDQSIGFGYLKTVVGQ